MKNTQDSSTLELGNILSNYFRLTPDKYARRHFQNYLQDSYNAFDPQVAYNWLRMRVQQDSTPVKSLNGETVQSSPIGFKWADFDSQLQDIALSEMFNVSRSFKIISSIRSISHQYRIYSATIDLFNQLKPKPHEKHYDSSSNSARSILILG
jgi:hypothetical protein